MRFVMYENKPPIDQSRVEFLLDITQAIKSVERTIDCEKIRHGRNCGCPFCTFVSRSVPDDMGAKLYYLDQALSLAIDREHFEESCSHALVN